MLRAPLPLVKRRLAGIVSRGGSLLAKWMLAHGEENPTYAHFDAICGVMRRYDVITRLDRSTSSLQFAKRRSLKPTPPG